MDEKKYQIFVSSTYDDLKDARAKVIETILKLYHFPIGMEMFSADDAEQWEVITDTIDTSDYYIVIIGHRYGSITIDGLSYTEKEYDYAKNQNIPVLAFIRKRDVSTKPDERDQDPGRIGKLDKFVKKASKSKMCDFWENENDLSTKVAIALPKIFRKTPRIGWVMANKAISPQVSEEMAKLSSENRDLRKERDLLKNKIEGKKPKIFVKINDSENLEFLFTEKEQLSFELPPGNKLTFKPVEYPEKIESESVPEHLEPFFVTSAVSDIEKYNNSLPSKDEIDEFNSLKEMYFRSKGASTDLSFEIENLGTSKANEIFIEIEFPDEIRILKKSDIQDIEFPESPIPENPIKVAERKYEDRVERVGRLGIPTIDFLNTPSINHLSNFSPDMFVGRDISTDLIREENKITITIKSLLHTRKIQIDDFIAIPLETGQFEIKVSIVCEEYSELKNKLIPIIVKK